jgi:phosphoserine phosphatase RsbU/P
MSNRQPRKRVAVLIDHVDLLSAGYETQLRHSFEAACRRLNLDLLLVCGRSFDDKQGADSARCLINQLITKSAVDGAIVTAAVAAGPGLPKFREWIDRRPSLPLCCVGLTIPGIPGITIDNSTGMREITEHLVRDHHCRRFAFLKGTANNVDGEVRYAVFRETLLEHGIAIDERLVACGNFVRFGGVLAMREIIERNVPFDAVVAANDGMALGAIDALRERGFRVPQNVAVTGFDDMKRARFANPPLTTVHQPVERVGESAIETIFDILNGRQVADVIQLPTRCVIRESCGCRIVQSSASLVEGHATSEAAVDFIQRVRDQLRTTVIGLMTADSGTHEQAGELVDALERELAGQEGKFLSVLDSVLENIRQDNELHNSLQLVVGHLRSEMSRFQVPELTELWDMARTRIALANTYSQAQQRYLIEESYEQWVGIGEALAAAFDLGSLKRRLCVCLRGVGISSFIVSLYAPNTQNILVPYVVVVDDSEVEVSNSPYAADLLFPPDLGMLGRRTTWNCFPLAFEEQPVGIVCLENRGAVGYQLLCDQISAAVRNVRLHQEIVEKTLLHERSVQERMATAKRLQSLSVLAGGVAHDLNNALGPLVALPDVMRADIVQLLSSASDTVPRL